MWALCQPYRHYINRSPFKTLHVIHLQHVKQFSLVTKWYKDYFLRPTRKLKVECEAAYESGYFAWEYNTADLISYKT